MTVKIPTLDDYGMEFNEDYCIEFYRNRYAKLYIRNGYLCCSQRTGYREGYKRYRHYKPPIDESKQYYEMLGYIDTKKYVLFVYKPTDYEVEEPIEDDTTK